MKKLLLATTALALFGAIGAKAADMNVTPLRKAPPPVDTPASDWGGFYLGFHGGYGSGTSSLDTTTTVTGVVLPTPPVTFSNPSPKGVLWGGEVGYNWQIYNAVVGLEVDYSAADLTDSQNVAIANVATVTANLATKIDALASGRARVGYVVMPALLIYGTGGVAWGHGSATEGIAQATPAASISQTAFANQFGWVVGAGTEIKLADHFLIRGEFLHYDFGDVSFAFPNTAGLNAVFANSASAKVSVNVARGGIGFKF